METLYARRHEHDHRHDRPWLRELPRASDGKPESPIYPSTHDRHYYCCACGHEGRKGGPPRVSLGRIHKLRAPMAAAAWRLEGFAHPVPGSRDPRRHLPAHHSQIHLSAGTALRCDAAGACTLLCSARPGESNCATIHCRQGGDGGQGCWAVEQRGKAQVMSDTSKREDLTKPPPWRSPRGDFPRTRWSKAGTARSFPRLRRATAS